MYKSTAALVLGIPILALGVPISDITIAFTRRLLSRRSPFVADRNHLHHVLDQWFAQEVKPRLRGRVFMTRFADDVVMGFELEEDAEKVVKVLPKRFGKYGLTIHPDKTRLVAFGRPRGTQGKRPEIHIPPDLVVTP